MPTLQLKQNDTEALQLQLVDHDGPCDLTTASEILFRMEAQSADRYIEVVAEADASLGWINVPWADDDLDTPGVYRAEVKVTKENGKVQTFPTDGEPPYLVVKINAAVVEDAP